MIASCEPEATAAWILAALPPLPANAGEATNIAEAARMPAASLVPMVFMVFSFPRGSVGRRVGVVLAAVVVHAHVGREDELVELGRRELGVALLLRVRRRGERADARVGRREQLRRVQL